MFVVKTREPNPRHWELLNVATVTILHARGKIGEAYGNAETILHPAATGKNGGRASCLNSARGVSEGAKGGNSSWGLAKRDIVI